MSCDYRGQGEPLLLFVHGWTCRKAYWTPQLNHFATTHAVAALDLPGHGDSGTGQRKDWNLSTFALDVIACVEALRPEKLILIGHSMGGAVVLEAARRLGGKVAGVVLVDTFVIDYGGLPMETVQAIAAPFAENFAEAMAALIEQTATATTPEALKVQLIREMSAADPAWALPVWRDLLCWSPESAFSELQVPIHAINGALIPSSAREHCAPFVTESIIPGAGHFLQMENPAGFNWVLEQILPRLR